MNLSLLCFIFSQLTEMKEKYLLLSLLLVFSFVIYSCAQDRYIRFETQQVILNDFEADITSEYVFKSSGPLEKAVQQDQDAIAITGISSAKRRDVKILSLNGKFPSYENIKSGDFVLYRPLYIVVNYLKPQSDAAEQFVSFALSDEGRQIIRKNGTVPYRDGYNLIQKMLRQNRKSFRDRKS